MAKKRNSNILFNRRLCL